MLVIVTSFPKAHGHIPWAFGIISSLKRGSPILNSKKITTRLFLFADVKSKSFCAYAGKVCLFKNEENQVIIWVY